MIIIHSNKYKIIFDDNINELTVVPTHMGFSNMVSFSITFETDKPAKEFIKLINSLYLACDMRDKKMFIRIFNRLLEF